MNGCFRYVEVVNDEYVCKMPLGDHQEEALQANDQSCGDWTIDEADSTDGAFSNLTEMALYKVFGDKCAVLCPIDLERSSVDEVYMRKAKLPVTYDSKEWTKEEEETLDKMTHDFSVKYKCYVKRVYVERTDKKLIEQECGKPAVKAYRDFYEELFSKLPEDIAAEIASDMHCNNWASSMVD